MGSGIDIKLTAKWDAAVDVFVVTSDAAPGLVLEVEKQEELEREMRLSGANFLVATGVAELKQDVNVTDVEVVGAVDGTPKLNPFSFQTPAFI